ncbi:MAG TPA: 50S ribosomal protein L29 [Candidatus Nanoarchaeia archaeon]|nr:50S ribosomal protein L29 [Candidatus Nanoarchaeia archaeon]
MKMKDIRSLKGKEVQDKLNEIRKELMKTNAQIALGATPKNPGNVRVMKRTIARILMEKSHPTPEKSAKNARKEVS